MKLKYLEANWEPVGEKEISSDYMLPDEVVTHYHHIVELNPDDRFSFLENIHIGLNDDIVESSYEISTTYFFNVGNSLLNHFNISLFYEKIDQDFDFLADLLGVEMMEYMEHGTHLSKNCAGIDIDIIGIDYGMVFINIPFWKKKQLSVEFIIDIAHKLDHYFYTILEEIKNVGKGVVPLIPSYAYDQKKITIFISHASKDKDFARRLRDSLKSENFETWFDEDDILVGDDFIQSMEEGLEKSDFIVIILSSNFSKGPWAIKEYRTALTEQINKGRVKILPVKYKESKPPAMLSSISHADLSKNYEQGLQNLLRSIRLRHSREQKK